jgi:hypothetical protein
MSRNMCEIKLWLWCWEFLISVSHYHIYVHTTRSVINYIQPGILKYAFTVPTNKETETGAGYISSFHVNVSEISWLLGNGTFDYKWRGVHVSRVSLANTLKN